MSRPKRVKVFRTVSQGTAQAFVILAVLALLVAGASSWFSVRAVQGEINSRASVVQLCQAGNEARAQQVVLWSHLVQVSVPPPHETAAQKQRRAAAVAGLLRYVRQVFAPRDCSHYNAG
jgi:hypothetical protein